MEKKRTLTIILTAVVLLAATTAVFRRGAPGEIDHGAIEPVKLSGHVLTDSNTMAIPTKVAIVGSYLITVDIASDSALHVLDRSTGEVVRSLGRRGGGPGEFEGAWTIDPVAQADASFWVSDLNLKRATLVDLSAGRDAHSAIYARFVSFVNEATLTGPILNSKGQWMSLGFFDQGRIGVFNSLGENITVLGEVPREPQNMHPVTRQQIRQSTLVADPERDRFAAMPRYASDFELINLEGNSTLVEGPVEIRANYFRHGPTRTGPAQTVETQFGYVDAAGSSQHLFGLFSGRNRKDFKNSAAFARFVHVFDWNGKILGVFQLEDDTLSIAVDEKGRTLYAIRHDPFPAIVRYDLAATDLHRSVSLAFSTNPVR